MTRWTCPGQARENAAKTDVDDNTEGFAFFDASSILLCRGEHARPVPVHRQDTSQASEHGYVMVDDVQDRRGLRHREEVVHGCCRLPVSACSSHCEPRTLTRPPCRVLS